MNVKEILNHQVWQVNKFLLITSGLWPYQNGRVKLCIRLLLISIILVSLIPQIIRFQMEWGRDLEIIIYNFTAILYFKLAIVRYISCICIESKLRIIYEQITKDWEEFTDKEEKIILQQFTNIGRKLSVAYLVFAYGGAVFFVFSPFLISVFLDYVQPLNTSREKHLCFYGEYFIDQRIYFYPLLVHNLIFTLCSNVIFTTIDSTYPTLVQHVIGLFNIVDYRLKQVFHLVQIQQIRKSKEISREIHKGVLRSIDVHKKSISPMLSRFVSQLESTFKTCLFLSISLLSISLSIGPVVIVMNVKNILTFLRMLVVLFAGIIFLFYTSLPSEKIIEASLSISSSIYFCGWYDFPLKTQRLLVFMMIKASIPCQFTAGPLLILNYKNCLVIMKLSLSYFTYIMAIS